MAKPKNRSQLGRHGPRREPYDRVLIACEDSTATPRYLKSLIRDLGISSANWVFAPHEGSAPISVVNAAIEAFGNDREFDQVYCVIDKDTHTTYGEALGRVAGTQLVRRKSAVAKKQPVTFSAIRSVPCFEFWLLLHFNRCTAPMLRYNDVLPRLRECAGFAHYDKGATDSYELTKLRLDDALINANHANASAAATDTDNPTTQIGALVLALRQIKD